MPSLEHQKQGGHARAAKLSTTERSNIARKGGQARWKKPQEILRDIPRLEAICRKHNIKTLYVFGSIITDDFGPKSDVDLLFSGDLDYFKMCHANDDFEALFGRKVDLIRYEAVLNAKDDLRCKHIVANMEKVLELQS